MAEREITILTRVIDEASKPMKQIVKTTRELGNNALEVRTRFIEASDGVSRVTKEVTEAIPKVRRFRFEFLSFMFAGQAISRTMDRITRSTVSTFMKMTQGQTEASKSLIAFTANWEFLKFSVGDALARVFSQLLPILIPLIQAFANFAQANPHLVFIAIVGALIGSKFLSAISQFMMLINSIMLLKANRALTEHINQINGINPVPITTVWDKLQNIAKTAAKGIGIGISFLGITELTQALMEGSGEKIKNSIADILIGAGIIAAASGVGFIPGAVIVTLGLILKFTPIPDIGDIRDTFDPLKALGVDFQTAVEDPFTDSLFNVSTTIEGISKKMGGDISHTLSEIRVGINTTIETAIIPLANTTANPLQSNTEDFLRILDNAPSIMNPYITKLGEIKMAADNASNSLKENISLMNQLGGLAAIGAASISGAIRGGTRRGDFIMRPGQSPVSFSPQDTVVGFNGSQMGAMSIGDINVNISTGTVSSSMDMRTIAREVSDIIVSDIRKRVGPSPTKFLGA